jgi:transcriptional regulator GlxA family with amidase domain
VRTSLGFEIVAPHGLAPVAAADLVVVPAIGTDYLPPDDVVRALVDAVDRGARVVSMCTGAFVLARAGLLAGRRATTHLDGELSVAVLARQAAMSERTFRPPVPRRHRDLDRVGGSRGNLQAADVVC